MEKKKCKCGKGALKLHSFNTNNRFYADLHYSEKVRLYVLVCKKCGRWYPCDKDGNLFD